MSGSIGTIFRPYRLRLAGTYTLSLAEYVLELMYPFAIGLAINGKQRALPQQAPPARCPLA